MREGRRREFEHFASFAGGLEIPDPTHETTFVRSVLDWTERMQSPHQEILEDTRALLALRHERVVPLTRSRYLGATTETRHGCIDVTWNYEAGNLRFVANLSEHFDEISTGGAEVIWTSPHVARGSEQIKLAPWQGAAFSEGP